MADAASLLIKLGFRTDTGVLSGLERRLDSLNNKVRFIAGVEVVRGLVSLTQRFGESAFEIENAAAAAGITTDALQKLEYAATQSGVEGNKLGESMFHLSRVLYQAKMGSEEAQQTFYQLGISTQQLSTFKNAEEALYGVMDAVKAIDDPIKQQALIEKTLGRGSREMVRFALAGSAAAKATGKVASGMGALVPASALNRLSMARQSMMTAHRIFDAFSANLGAKFAPVVIQAAEALEHFYVGNKKVIDTTLQAWVDRAAYAIGYFVGILETAGKDLLNFVGSHKDLVVSSLKIATAIRLISAAFSLMKPALTGIQFGAAALGFLFEVGPFILAALAIGGVTAALHDLWKIVSTGGTVKAEDLWLYQLTHGVGALGEPIQWLIDKTASLVDFFAPGTMRPTIAGSTVNGMSPDDPRLAALVAKAKQFTAPGTVLSQLSAPPPGPGMSMAAPSTANYYNQNSASQRTVNMPVTINTGNVSPADAMKAISSGVGNALKGEAGLEQANRRFDSPFVY